MSDQKTWERQQFEREEIKKYGVVTYSRKSEEYRSDVVVIPIEIKVGGELNYLTPHQCSHILQSFQPVR
jgi:hypothetical protein